MPNDEVYPGKDPIADAELVHWRTGQPLTDVDDPAHPFRPMSLAEYMRVMEHLIEFDMFGPEPSHTCRSGAHLRCTDPQCTCSCTRHHRERV